MNQADYQEAVDACKPYFDTETDCTALLWRENTPQALKKLYKFIERQMFEDGYEINQFTFEVEKTVDAESRLIELQELEELKNLSQGG